MIREQLHQLILENFINSIISMLRTFLLALPLGLLSGAVSVVFIECCKTTKKIKRKKKSAIVLFTIYVIMMLQMAIIFRPLGKIKEMDVIPFNTPGGIRYIVLYVLANILIFVPVGILVPMIWNEVNSIKKILIVGAIMSLVIESLQLVLQCGTFQTEDLIVNTIGAGIGYLILKKCARHKSLYKK